MVEDSVIIIPIYKKELSAFEKASLIQCIKILKAYDVALICPVSLDLENYDRIFKAYKKEYKIVRFEDKHFESIFSYNLLMLSPFLYEQFLDYKYMLIYQLDAWVFEDKLEYWCNKDFDYIGAPWFDLENGFNLVEYSGNGGLSLRKVETMYQITSSKPFLKPDFETIYTKLKSKNKLLNFFIEPISMLISMFSKKYTPIRVSKKFNRNEDTILSNDAKQLIPNLKVAKGNIALDFSFEGFPSRAYKLNNNKLPFGCHGFMKYEWDGFWRKFINVDENIIETQGVGIGV